MTVKVKRKEGESMSQMLKRFLLRFQKSGIALEVKKRLFRSRKWNERRKWEYRMYRLKLQQFIQEKMKEGWSFDKAYEMGKRYIQEIKYKG